MSNTSFYANLYLAMQARIAATCPWAWIEQDFGQDTLNKWRPNVNGFTGAVLIDFNNTTYSEESRNTQFGLVQISVRLFFYPFSQSYSGAPLEVAQDALNYFDLESDLVSALHGWQALDEKGNPFSQSLVRQMVRSNNRNDMGLRIREMVFVTAYEEDFDLSAKTMVITRP